MIFKIVVDGSIPSSLVHKLLKNLNRNLFLKLYKKVNVE